MPGSTAGKNASYHNCATFAKGLILQGFLLAWHTVGFLIDGIREKTMIRVAMPSVFIKTYGCQMNERDSEAVAAQLVAKGYTLAKSEAAADVVLLNTCSVRDFAEQKAINKMQNIVGTARSEKRNQVVGFMGCMAQSRGRELIDKLPDVDLVLGTQKFHRAAEYLDELLAGRREHIVDVESEARSEATIREHLVNGNARTSVSAFVSIMQGCNQHCTFCIVPATRGEERSRTIADVVAECRELAGRGVKEITLLGQIVTSYGRREQREAWQDGGLRPAIVEAAEPQAELAVEAAGGHRVSPFVQLLEAVHEIEGLERIRFTSPHPKGYGDDLVTAYVRLPKLCENAICRYKAGATECSSSCTGVTRGSGLPALCKNCGKPGLALALPRISSWGSRERRGGFWADLVALPGGGVRQRLHLQVLAAPGYPGGRDAGGVPLAMREERNQRLLELVNSIAARKYDAFIGRQVQILVEGPEPQEQGAVLRAAPVATRLCSSMAASATAANSWT